MRAATIEKVREAMGMNANLETALDPADVGVEFRRTCADNPGITLLLLTTSDGRSIAEMSSASADPRRIAAMTNSYLTLGETVARELGLPSTDYASISTPKGNVVLIRIPDEKPMTLVALGLAETNAALLLFSARECAARIARLLPSR